MHGCVYFFFFQAEDGIRDGTVTGVQTCALPISKFCRHAAYRQNFVPTPRQIERHRGAGTAQTAAAKPRAFHARRYAPVAPPESGPLVVSSRGGERWLSQFSLRPVSPGLLE